MEELIVNQAEEILAQIIQNEDRWVISREFLTEPGGLCGAFYSRKPYPHAHSAALQITIIHERNGEFNAVSSKCYVLAGKTFMFNEEISFSTYLEAKEHCNYWVAVNDALAKMPSFHFYGR